MSNILLALTGSVAAITAPRVIKELETLGTVSAVATNSAIRFLAGKPIPDNLYTDVSEHWQKVGDPVVHIQLRRWADVLVIAPLSANTLAKMAHGLCDNLVTDIVRAWEPNKPIVVAPSMNTRMWDSRFTVRHLNTLDQEIFPHFYVAWPVHKTLVCGDEGDGAMAEAKTITELTKEALRIYDATRTVPAAK